MRKHNIIDVSCKDCTNWTLNQTRTQALILTLTVTHYFDITAQSRLAIFSFPLNADPVIFRASDKSWLTTPMNSFHLPSKGCTRKIRRKNTHKTHPHIHTHQSRKILEWDWNMNTRLIKTNQHLRSVNSNSVRETAKSLRRNINTPQIAYNVITTVMILRRKYIKTY